MHSLIAAAPYELKDKRSLELASKYPDLAIYKNIHAVISEAWLVDRTESVKLPFKTHLTDEHRYPAFKNSTESLDVLLVQRAKEILLKNKHIYLWWSGGIDSTAAVIAFLLAGASKEQLTVVCNYDSIKEYSEFYLKHIRGNFPIMSSELMIQKIKQAEIDAEIVSCEHGDLLYSQDFGMIMFDLFGPDYLYKSADRVNVVNFFVATGMNELSANCWYDIFTANLNQSPRHIKNMYDFSWWVGNNWRWQWAIEKVRLRSEFNINLSTFYSGVDLQSWAVTHEQYPIQKKSDFKKQSKDFIFNFTKDKIYYDNKIKYASATIYYGADAFTAIRNDQTRIRSKDFSLMDYYQEDNFISDWLKDQ